MAPQQRWPSGRHGPGRPDAFRLQAPIQHQGEIGGSREHQLWPMLHMAAGVLSLPTTAGACTSKGVSWVLTGAGLMAWLPCSSAGLASLQSMLRQACFVL